MDHLAKGPDAHGQGEPRERRGKSDQAETQADEQQPCCIIPFSLSIEPVPLTSLALALLCTLAESPSACHHERWLAPQARA